MPEHKRNGVNCQGRNTYSFHKAVSLESYTRTSVLKPRGKVKWARVNPGVNVAKFQTVIKHACFVYSPYTATEMQGFAQVLADSIRARIQSGQNIYDQAAAPLKPGPSGRRGYPDYKAALADGRFFTGSRRTPNRSHPRGF